MTCHALFRAVLCVLLSAVIAHRVVELESEYLRTYIKDGTPIFVKFTAPWCGHCKSLLPKFEEASAKLSEANVPVVMANVDCSNKEAEPICIELEIKGYPTLLFFKEGKKATFDGKRTVDGITSWVKGAYFHQIEESKVPASEAATDVVVGTDANFDQLLSEKKYVLAKFFAPWCGHCKAMAPAFAAAAKRLKETSVTLVHVDCTEHTLLCKKQKVYQYPSLYFYSPEGKVRYDGGRSTDGILQWVADKTGEQPAPVALEAVLDDGVAVLTDALFEEYLEINKNVFVEFYAPWCGHCKKLAPHYATAAKQLRGVVPFAKVDCTQNTRTCSTQGLEGYPTLRWFSSSAEPKDFTGARTAPALVVFAHRQLGLSEPPVAATRDADVLALTNATFEQTIFNAQYVMVEFYAPWCGHCQQLAPQYAAAATQLKGEAVLAKLDCTAWPEVCEKSSVSAYPTLILFTMTTPDIYEGKRTTEAIVSYVKSNIVPLPLLSDGDVAVVTPSWFSSVIRSSSFFLRFFHPDNDTLPETEQFRQAATVAAHALSVRVGQVDCRAHAALCATERLRVSSYPSYVLFRHSQAKLFTDTVTPANLLEFLRNETGASKPTDFEASGIQQLDGGEIDAFLDNTPCALILFFAPWCEHSRTLLPVVGKAVLQLPSQVAVAMADCTRPSTRATCSALGVRGYPSLMLWHRGSLVPYPGRRSVGSLSAWVLSHTAPSPALQQTVLTLQGLVPLSLANFSVVVGAQPVTAVLFTSEETHDKCLEASTSLHELASKKQPLNATFAKLCCSDEPQFCKQIGVTVFPSVSLLRRGRWTRYPHDDMGAAALWTWLRPRLASLLVEVTSVDMALQWRKSMPAVVLGLFSADQDSPLRTHYMEAAKANPKLPFAESLSPDVHAYFNASLPALLVLKQFDEGSVLLQLPDSISSAQGVVDFYRRSSKQSLLHWTDSTSPSVLATPGVKTHIAFFYDKAITDHEAQLRVFSAVAFQHRGDPSVLFFAVDRMYSDVAVFFAASDSELPVTMSLAIDSPTSGGVRYRLQRDTLSEHSLQHFVSGVLGRSLQRFVRSEPEARATPPTAGSVAVLVGTTVQAAVAAASSAGLLLLRFSPWCAQSKEAMVLFDKLAGVLEERKSSVLLAKIDGTANDICTADNATLPHTDFPSLYLFLAGDSAHPIPYHGVRTADAILRFVESKTHVPTSEATDSHDPKPRFA